MSLFYNSRQMHANRLMNLHMEEILLKEHKLVELQLFKKKMYVELYDNWGILILNREMEKLLQERWNEIHLNHPDSALFCSDIRCPKHKPILFHEEPLTRFGNGQGDKAS